MNLLLRISKATTCLLAIGLMAGCETQQEGGVVQGTVTIGGELAKSGTVAFHPKGEGPVAYGSIRSDGSFSLRIGQGNSSNVDYNKIPLGEYLASVSVSGPPSPDEEKSPGAPPIPGPRLSAEKYSNQETSGLSFVVKKGLNVFNLELEPASPEELEQEEKEEAEASDQEDAEEGETEEATRSEESPEESTTEEAAEEATSEQDSESETAETTTEPAQ